MWKAGETNLVPFRLALKRKQENRYPNPISMFRLLGFLDLCHIDDQIEWIYWFEEKDEEAKAKQAATQKKPAGESPNRRMDSVDSSGRVGFGGLFFFFETVAL